MNSPFAFVGSRRFLPLFVTQFSGAFNDNFLKTIIFVLITFHGLGGDSVLPASQWLNVGAILFILPYFLFSAISGEISTRFDKAKIAKIVKLVEVLIMGLAIYGLWVHSLAVLLLCLFLMGAQSTLFGPLKYAIVPDYLQRDELVMGNGLIEGATFVAILLGQFVASALTGSDYLPGGVMALGGLLLLFALIGLVASLLMPTVAPKNPYAKINPHFLRSTRQLLEETWVQPSLKTAIVGISWFWFLGSVYVTQLPTFTAMHLGGDQGVLNILLTLFSVGVGVGSVGGALLSRGRLNLRLVFYGASGMTVFGVWLSLMSMGVYQGEPLQGAVIFLSSARAYGVMALMLLLGACAGIFLVPLYTWLQLASDDQFRAHAVAANNIVNGLFMVVAALFSALLLWLYHHVALLYLVAALGNFVLMYFFVKTAPHMWEKDE